MHLNIFIHQPSYAISTTLILWCLQMINTIHYSHIINIPFFFICLETQFIGIAYYPCLIKIFKEQVQFKWVCFVAPPSHKFRILKTFHLEDNKLPCLGSIGLQLAVTLHVCTVIASLTQLFWVPTHNSGCYSKSGSGQCTTLEQWRLLKGAKNFLKVAKNFLKIAKNSNVCLE